MSTPRFIVLYATGAEELERKLQGYDEYDVIQMTSGPWFDHDIDGKTLKQTCDSIYVILEKRRPFPTGAPVEG